MRGRRKGDALPGRYELRRRGVLVAPGSRRPRRRGMRARARLSAITSADLRFQAMELATGQIVGAYRLIRKLGEGTTSRVFEVEHVRIRRRAAMKIAHT